MLWAVSHIFKIMSQRILEQSAIAGLHTSKVSAQCHFQLSAPASFHIHFTLPRWTRAALRLQLRPVLSNYHSNWVGFWYINLYIITEKLHCINCNVQQLLLKCELLMNALMKPINNCHCLLFCWYWNRLLCYCSCLVIRIGEVVFNAPCNTYLIT